MTEVKSSKSKTIIGWILSGLIILFMLMDSIMKFVKPDEVVRATIDLGFQEKHIAVMGALALISTVLYAVKRTSFIGAILLTAYFGGAVVTHLRLDHSLFGHTLFPVYFGIIVWLGFYLRNYGAIQGFRRKQ